jgi:hypothetical protein
MKPKSYCSKINDYGIDRDRNDCTSAEFDGDNIKINSLMPRDALFMKVIFGT